MPKFKAYIVYEAAPGHSTGVYDSYLDAKGATDGVSEAPQGFRTREEAERVFNGGEPDNPTRFYVVEPQTRIYFTFHDAKVASGGNAQNVQKFKHQIHAEGTIARFDRSRQPPRLDGSAISGGGLTVVLDVETTGLSFERDQIVELSLLTYEGGVCSGDPHRYRFRPNVAEMSQDAENIHHITSEMLEDEPTFQQRAPEIRLVLGSATCLMGYNIRFDIKMLQAEFARADGIGPLNLIGVSIIDPYAIWMNQSRRRLADAHEQFLHSPFEGAHDSTADIIATAHVFNAMLERFDLSNRSARELDSIFRRGQVDIDGKFIWGGDGQVLFNFGQYKLRPIVDVADQSYLQWMLGQDFSDETRRIVALALECMEDEDRFNDIVVAEFGGPNR